MVKCLQNLRDAFRTPIIASDYFSAADHGIGLKRCVDAFTEEDWKLFEDLDSYKKFRHELEQEMNSLHAATLKGSDLQKHFRQLFQENMLKKLSKRPWIADHIVPDFPVACRRVTPGPGYLNALCQDNVTFFIC